mgnify:CR=1 FL=1
MKSNKYNICIIGLGYVGLPLAIEFGKKFLTIGYDINIKRIDDLNNFKDSNNEIATYDFKKSKKLIFSNNETDITNSNVYILTLPTPINKKNKPELTNLGVISFKFGLRLNTLLKIGIASSNRLLFTKAIADQYGSSAFSG